MFVCMKSSEGSIRRRLRPNVVRRCANRSALERRPFRAAKRFFPQDVEETLTTRTLDFVLSITMQEFEPRCLPNQGNIPGVSTEPRPSNPEEGLSIGTGAPDPSVQPVRQLWEPGIRFPQKEIRVLPRSCSRTDACVKMRGCPARS